MGRKALLAVICWLTLSEALSEKKTVNNSVADSQSEESAPRLYQHNIPVGVYASAVPYAAHSFHVPSFVSAPGQFGIKSLKDSYGQFVQTPQTAAYKSAFPQQFVQLQDLPAHLSQPLLAAAPNIQYKQAGPQYFFGSQPFRIPALHHSATPTPVTSFGHSQPLIYAENVKNFAPSSNLYTHANRFQQQSHQREPQAQKYVASESGGQAKQQQQQVTDNSNQEGQIQAAPAQTSVTAIVNGKKTVVTLETQPPLPLLDLNLLEPLKFDNPLVPQVQHFLPRINSATYHKLPKFNVNEGKNGLKGHDSHSYDGDVIVGKPKKQAPKKKTKPRVHNAPVGPSIIIKTTPQDSPEISYEINKPGYKETYNEQVVSYNKETNAKPVTYTYNMKSHKEPVTYSFTHNSKEPLKVTHVEYDSDKGKPKELVYKLNPQEQHEEQNEEGHRPQSEDSGDSPEEADDDAHSQPQRDGHNHHSKHPHHSEHSHSESPHHHSEHRGHHNHDVPHHTSHESHHGSPRHESHHDSPRHHESHHDSPRHHESHHDAPRHHHSSHETHHESPRHHDSHDSPRHHESHHDTPRHHSHGHHSSHDAPKQYHDGPRHSHQSHHHHEKPSSHHHSDHQGPPQHTQYHSEHNTYHEPPQQSHHLPREHRGQYQQGPKQVVHHEIVHSTPQYSQPLQVSGQVDQFQPIIQEYEEDIRLEPPQQFATLKVDPVQHIQLGPSTPLASQPPPSPAPQRAAPQHDRPHSTSPPRTHHASPAPHVVEKTKRIIINENEETPDDEQSAEQIMGQMLQQNENSEEDFEKAYKESAFGFPAYEETADTEKDIYNPDSYGAPKYHNDYDIDHTPFEQYQEEGDEYPKSSRAEYKDARDKMKENYFLEFAVHKPESFLDRFKKKEDYYKVYSKQRPEKIFAQPEKQKEKYVIAAPSYVFPASTTKPKQNQFFAHYKAAPKRFEYDYSKGDARDSRAFASRPLQRFHKTHFVEPQFQYGFEPMALPLVLDSELAAMASNQSPAETEKPGIRKKVYKENWYIKKTSTTAGKPS